MASHYAYVWSKKGRPVYIGKGYGKRACDHLGKKEWASDSEILTCCLVKCNNDAQAKIVESFLIQYYGVENLKNKCIPKAFDPYELDHHKDLWAPIGISEVLSKHHRPDRFDDLGTLIKALRIMKEAECFTKKTCKKEFVATIFSYISEKKRPNEMGFEWGAMAAWYVLFNPLGDKGLFEGAMTAIYGVYNG